MLNQRKGNQIMNTEKMIPAASELAEDMRRFIASGSGKRPEGATIYEKWIALTRAVMARIGPNWYDTSENYSKGRQAHYFSAEFLVGRSLVNNLINLGIYEEADEALKEFGTSLAEIEEQESDPGLGNGGLGRLAACFLDSAATHDLPLTGYGIMYRYGLFRQEIEDGFQKEYPDIWREKGYPGMVRRDELSVKIHYDDLEVNAVPYDLPITGFGTKNVNTLRLWMAKPAQEFDFNLFNSQRFDDAVIGRNRVNDIWRVLYPNDTSYDGKVLRVRQQYFFVSASLQDIVRKHKEVFGGDLSNFAQYHAIQLNDTHPVIAIPELMRILTKENGIEWSKAWEITKNTFAFTNHTILSEAMEKWDTGIFKYLFAEIYAIIERINNQFRAELSGRHIFQDQIDMMAPIGDGKVRMAWLAIYGTHSVNGVAALHTKLLIEKELKDWYMLWPEKFSNKTNGVTPRRWLRKANPELSALITELLGSEDWVRDLPELSKLMAFVTDKTVLDRFMAVKQVKKKQLADHILRANGIELDTDSIFDIQIKRLHEYKRQLLNVISILDIYYDIKDAPEEPRVPRTFIFGAKAAPGYFRAKGIIKLINETAKLVNSDPVVAKYIKVVFVNNYNVSLAEKLFPAADVSEQISTAGYEASGTGNMKFMMNGTVTHGTYDGANVEIAEAAGPDNIFIFGARVEHLPDIRGYYNPVWQYENIPGLSRALNALVDGTLNDGGTGMFRDIFNALLYGTSWEPADPFYLLGDFDDYRKTRLLVDEAYQDKYGFAAKCWMNICTSGVFSSDRTVRDYAEDIWKISRVALG